MQESIKKFSKGKSLMAKTAAKISLLLFSTSASLLISRLFQNINTPIMPIKAA